MALSGSGAAARGVARGYVGSVESAKNYFFDRKIVMERAAKANAKASAKFGAFVRRTAQTSIRSRKKASPPGTPPSNRTGLLKKNIFFAFDPRTGGVVVGPALLNGRGAKAVGETVPSALETGGRIVIKERQFKGQWSAKSRGRGNRFEQGTRFRVESMAARPFMRPALEKNRSKFPGMFRGTMGG